MRNTYIDFLRFIGLTLIILAHVKAPVWITELRCFDVPLMVFVSGISFKFSGGGYFMHRIKRICIPVYSFLIFLFFLVFLSKWIYGSNFYSGKQMLGSLLLLNNPSIGYVWIFRIFLLMAFVAPFIYWISIRMSKKQSWGFIVAIFVLQAILVKCQIQNQSINFLYREYFLYLLGYGVFLFLGMRLRVADEDERKRLLHVSCVACLASVIYSCLTNNLLSDYKYPPHSIFAIYGASASVILYLAKDKLSRFVERQKAAISFIGANSMWIYLWHIPLVFIMNNLLQTNSFWILRWISVYVMAIGIYWIQMQIIRFLLQKCPQLNFKYWI